MRSLLVLYILYPTGSILMNVPFKCSQFCLPPNLLDFASLPSLPPLRACAHDDATFTLLFVPHQPHPKVSFGEGDTVSYLLT